MFDALWLGDTVHLITIKLKDTYNTVALLHNHYIYDILIHVQGDQMLKSHHYMWIIVCVRVSVRGGEQIKLTMI